MGLLDLCRPAPVLLSPQQRCRQFLGHGRTRRGAQWPKPHRCDLASLLRSGKIGIAGTRCDEAAAVAGRRPACVRPAPVRPCLCPHGPPRPRARVPAERVGVAPRSDVAHTEWLGRAAPCRRKCGRRSAPRSVAGPIPMASSWELLRCPTAGIQVSQRTSVPHRAIGGRAPVAGGPSADSPPGSPSPHDCGARRGITNSVG